MGIMDRLEEETKRLNAIFGLEGVNYISQDTFVDALNSGEIEEKKIRLNNLRRCNGAYYHFMSLGGKKYMTLTDKPLMDL
jgi:hypothetical protein